VTQICISNYLNFGQSDTLRQRCRRRWERLRRRSWLSKQTAKNNAVIDRMTREQQYSVDLQRGKITRLWPAQIDFANCSQSMDCSWPAKAISCCPWTFSSVCQYVRSQASSSKNYLLTYTERITCFMWLKWDSAVIFYFLTYHIIIIVTQYTVLFCVKIPLTTSVLCWTWLLETIRCVSCNPGRKVCPLLTVTQNIKQHNGTKTGIIKSLTGDTKDSRHFTTGSVNIILSVQSNNNLWLLLPSCSSSLLRCRCRCCRVRLVVQNHRLVCGVYFHVPVFLLQQGDDV